MTPERLQEIEAQGNRGSSPWMSILVSEAREIIAEVRRLTAERDEAVKDAAFHAECRPNRQRAEAAMADAKATHDRWADEVVRREAAEATIATLREQLATFEPYLKDGETPIERLKRERADVDAMLTLLAHSKRDTEAARADRDRLQAERDALREQLQAAQVEVARLTANDKGVVQGLRNLTASFQCCDDCGQDACDDAKPDGPHILCHDCVQKHKAALAAPDTLPPLPSGWYHVGGPMGPYAGLVEYKCADTNEGVRLWPSGDVQLTGCVNYADLITVLRHAHAAQQRLAHATPAQEGQEAS